MNELKALFERKAHPVCYDGFEPSGRIHIAQGLLRAHNTNKLTRSGVKFVFYVADYFALLNLKMGGDLTKIRECGEYFIEIWKSCGMNLENARVRVGLRFHRTILRQVLVQRLADLTS